MDLDDGVRAALMKVVGEQLPSMLAYWDVTLRCQFANHAYEAWLGAASGTLVGQAMPDVLGARFPPTRLHVEAALRGEEQHLEGERAEPGAGPPIHTRTSYLPDIIDGAVRGFTVLVTAITPRTRTEDRAGTLALRGVLEAAPAAMVAIDPARRIVLANRGARDLFGATAAELEGQPLGPLLLSALDGAPLAGDPASAPGPRADRSLELHLSDLDTPGGPLTVVSLLDVSARTQGEQVRQQLASLVESAEDAIVIADRAGTIRAWNPGATALLGYRPDEIIGQPVTRLVPLARHDEAARIHEQVSRGQRVTLFETVRVRRDGAEVRVALTISPIHGAHGEVIGATKIMHDLSERDLAQEQFRAVVEMSPAALLMVDDGGVIVLVNRTTEVLFGYTRDELLGARLELLVPMRFRDAEGSDRYLAGAHVTVTDQPLYGRHKLGAELPIEVTLGPIRTRAGTFTLASITDITRRKRVEDELRRSNAELEQFAYIASHDLQEPLRMVASYTELLRERYQGQLDARADKYIHYAVDGAKRMQRLVADLLAYSRLDSQGRPMAPVAAGPLVDRVLRSLEVAIREAGATIEVGALPEVRGDESQLGPLFQNLIGNAIKFRGEAPVRIRIEAHWLEDRWRFSIADNGIGIEMKYADRIFQMFQRLHERGRYDGSGIGLTIARRIVERHEGAIWLESQPGTGTTFYFTLHPSASAPRP